MINRSWLACRTSKAPLKFCVAMDRGRCAGLARGRLCPSGLISQPLLPFSLIESGTFLPAIRSRQGIVRQSRTPCGTLKPRQPIEKAPNEVMVPLRTAVVAIPRCLPSHTATAPKRHVMKSNPVLRGKISTSPLVHERNAGVPRPPRRPSERHCLKTKKNTSFTPVGVEAGVGCTRPCVGLVVNYLPCALRVVRAANLPTTELPFAW